MDSRIIKLDWDTNYFGVPSSRITLNGQHGESEFKQLKAELFEFDFITIVNVENNSFNNYLIGKYTTGFLVDVNVQFVKIVKNDNIIQRYKVSNNYEYNAKLLEIANNEFTFSRFYNDPNLNMELSHAIYQNWVKNSFNKEKKYFIVAKENDIIQGFIMFSIINRNHITIELISLSSSSQGMGIGTRLLNSLEAYALAEKLEKIYVGTQIDNVQAINFYMKKGFSYNSKNSIYHYWPKMESVKNE